MTGYLRNIGKQYIEYCRNRIKRLGEVQLSLSEEQETNLLC